MLRIVSFSYLGLPEWGIITTDGAHILRAAELEEALFIPLPATVAELVANGPEGLVILQSALTQKEENEALTLTPLAFDEVTWDVPLLPIRNLFCVGQNYAAHVNEFSGQDSPLPSAPVYFTKATTTVLPHLAPLPRHPDVTKALDYEGELAVIIGQTTQQVDSAQALDHVFGYTIACDITARDLQSERGQWFLGKSLDGSCPLGPAILVGTPDEPFHLTTKVNGELRQAATTDEMLFSVAQLIADLSQGVTLLPGDIILTGTPAGVGKGFTPPRYLQSGDTVEITIDGIGTLQNTVQ
ncbi:fumarylacetoacetate hydrolase family protein [Negativicoccus succinicivorans]|uniref:fumarylacetoacetate hydrolase family protein n=1 Tax=Negativicoccus succinicivorans TaxID=620903 RepID=UPI0028D63FFA|nr:fumarylacetoacetate hydrolase family protein [Negativicoccus succinicivorans]